MLDTGYWILDAGCLMLDAGYWMLDAGCWMLDAGYLMLDYEILACGINHQLNILSYFPVGFKSST
jgi:hypothetical protein